MRALVVLAVAAAAAPSGVDHAKASKLRSRLRALRYERAPEAKLQQPASRERSNHERSTIAAHRRRHHAAKSEMFHRGVGRGCHARARSVARAVAVVAQETPATMNARNWRVRIARIARFRGASRIHHDCVRRGRSHTLRVRAIAVEIEAPLPHVSSDLIKAVAIRRIHAHRCCSRETIEREISPRKIALPDVATPRVPSAWIDRFIAPHVDATFESAARCKLPFSFGR